MSSSVMPCALTTVELLNEVDCDWQVSPREAELARRLAYAEELLADLALDELLDQSASVLGWGPSVENLQRDLNAERVLRAAIIKATP